MPTLFVSYIRTVVPLIAGWLLTLAVRTGIDIDSATVTAAVTVALGIAYYAVFRLLEWVGERLPGTMLQTVAGVLLGWARPPTYPKLETLPPVDPSSYSGGSTALS
ncbi:hypothetical protein [Streptomyces sp. C1-2]|uniref:hypothetical protein n=1 Tax=Streptomyces sp. C1-2 TaxID=2720022 RepID=UPI0014325CA1|nr:hypothetical protein [Streptomyces sp. C1-2]NJP70456.1 hypothetical protein [Streptomyces sp. C1-2]